MNEITICCSYRESDRKEEFLLPEFIANKCMIGRRSKEGVNERSERSQRKENHNEILCHLFTYFFLLLLFLLLVFCFITFSRFQTPNRSKNHPSFLIGFFQCRSLIDWNFQLERRCIKFLSQILKLQYFFDGSCSWTSDNYRFCRHRYKIVGSSLIFHKLLKSQMCVDSKLFHQYVFL